MLMLLTGGCGPHQAVLFQLGLDDPLESHPTVITQRH
jgi:hypothetical protein